MALALTMPLAAPAEPAVSQPAAGATPETAIVLPNITDEFHGVVAEHAYIADHFPTWHIEYQTTVEQNDHRYDLLGMIKPDNTKAMIYFDITDWVGK